MGRGGVQLMRWIAHWHEDLVYRMQGAPDFLLSTLLLIAAAVIVWAAFRAPATLKAGILAFIILP